MKSWIFTQLVILLLVGAAGYHVYSHVQKLESSLTKETQRVLDLAVETMKMEGELELVSDENIHLKSELEKQFHQTQLEIENLKGELDATKKEFDEKRKEMDDTQTKLRQEIDRKNKEIEEWKGKVANTSTSNTTPAPLTARGTGVVSKEYQMSATAYTAYCNGCSGTTKTGINLRDNPNQKVIAVDPAVIPLGSKVYVEGYGYAIAGDTGGAIKGHKIDLFMADKEDALAWGVKTVTVRVIN